MNSRPLSRRDRRALLLGVITLLLIGGIRGVPGWLRWRTDVRTTAVERVDLLASREASIRELDSMLDSAEARVARFRELAGALLVARDADELARSFQALLHDASRSSGGSLTIREIRVDSTLRPWAVSTVAGTVHVKTDFTGLQEFLARLQESGVIVSIPDATISVADASIHDLTIEVLDVEMTVEVGVLARESRMAGSR